jgi:hypothetical protein
MVRLFIRHDVADYDAWRKVYDEFDADRRPMGVTGDAVFQSIDDPNDVTVWHDFAEADEARGFVSSEALRAAMGRAGVQGEPQIWFVAQA